jgi:hypothetical protein
LDFFHVISTEQIVVNSSFKQGYSTASNILFSIRNDYFLTAF